MRKFFRGKMISFSIVMQHILIIHFACFQKPATRITTMNAYFYVLSITIRLKVLTFETYEHLCNVNYCNRNFSITLQMTSAMYVCIELYAYVCSVWALYNFCSTLRKNECPRNLDDDKLKSIECIFLFFLFFIWKLLYFIYKIVLSMHAFAGSKFSINMLWKNVLINFNWK